jgi:hypothetical protein
MTITAQRLKELERAEAKLSALETGGVDNWEYYAESLKQYHEENELEEVRSNLIGDLSDIFGECAYEPSERGAGIAFNEGHFDTVMELLIKYKVFFK